MKGEHRAGELGKLFDKVRGTNYLMYIEANAVLQAVKPSYKRVIMDSSYPWSYFITKVVEDTEGFKVILTFKTDSSD